MIHLLKYFDQLDPRVSLVKTFLCGFLIMNKRLQFNIKFHINEKDLIVRA